MEQDSYCQVIVDGQMIKTFRPIQQETLAEAHKFIEENHTKYYSDKVLQINAVHINQINPQAEDPTPYTWAEVVHEEHPFDIS